MIYFTYLSQSYYTVAHTFMLLLSFQSYYVSSYTYIDIEICGFLCYIDPNMAVCYLYYVRTGARHYINLLKFMLHSILFIFFSVPVMLLGWLSSFFILGLVIIWIYC
jgi:hypothetical protein